MINSLCRAILNSQKVDFFPITTDCALGPLPKKEGKKKNEKKTHCSSKNASMIFFITASTGVALYPLLLFLHIHKIIVTNKTYIALTSIFKNS